MKTVEKIYLDTSIISYLQQEDSPEKSHDDCYHIALAVLNECNYML